jgi:hypothetical protein
VPPNISRRGFLELAGGVALAGAGATVLAACSSSKSSAPTTISPFAVEPRVVSSDLYATSQPQRLAFTVISSTTGQPNAGKPAAVALAPPGGGQLGPFVPATARSKGLGQFRGVYTIDAELPRAGVWSAVVDYDGRRLSLPLQVQPKPQTITIGEGAPRAASPTTTHPLGAKRVCTRTPACPLHTTSLDTLIGKGRPVALLFATPAYCQTAYCGQVLDALLPLVSSHASTIDFVHCEIYLDAPTGPEIPTVGAWKLPSEPWFFGIDGKGIVQARLDGAFDQAEMQAVVERLT